MNNIKEDISMPEVLAMINESLTKIQLDITDLKQEISGLKQEISGSRQEMHEGFAYHETWLNRIEKNMATKSQFNSLLKVLESKDIISKFELNHIASSGSVV